MHKVTGSVFSIFLIFFIGMSLVSDVNAENAPKQFFLDFSDAYLVYVPANGTLQIAAVNNVLSYGADWEAKQLKPYLYHLRLRTWQGFFWKVNTSRKQVWMVTEGTFGQLGGTDKEKDFTVEVVGGAGDSVPDRFFLRFPQAYLVYVPQDKILQIIAGGNVLSYGADWEVQQLKTYLYHVRLKTWQQFFWKVNTSRKQVWRVENGTFGQLGGEDTELKIAVRVVE